MYSDILLIVQILVSLGIVGLVLMQHGKGADAGAAFGSGASGTVFGSQGSANFLSRTTAILATVFFLNSIALAWLVSGQPTGYSSVMESVSVEQVQPVAAESDVPAAPAATGEQAEVPAAPVAADAPQAEVPAAAAPVQSEVPTAPAAGEATQKTE